MGILIFLFFYICFFFIRLKDQQLKKIFALILLFFKLFLVFLDFLSDIVLVNIFFIEINGLFTYSKLRSY